MLMIYAIDMNLKMTNLKLQLLIPAGIKLKNWYVYHQIQGRDIKWAEGLLIIETGSPVLIFSLILDSWEAPFTNMV